MYRKPVGLPGGLAAVLALLLIVVPASRVAVAAGEDEKAGQFRVGWASADLTPEEPVILTGFSRARISEGVLDPITATALAMESIQDGEATGMAIMVSCDLISISDELRDQVRAMVKQSLPEIDTDKIVLNATHTHCGPETRTRPDLAKKLGEFGLDVPTAWSRWGVEMVSPRRLADADLASLTPPIYLTLDLDGLDPSEAPGVSHHEPGGLTMRELLDVIDALPGPIVGADVVELNPVRDVVGMTAMVGAKLVKEIAGAMLATG